MRGLLLSWLLVLFACATGPGEKRRDEQDLTIRMIGSSIIPIPLALAAGVRQDRWNTYEFEFGYDFVTASRVLALYNKHFWVSDFYTTQGISAPSGANGGQGHGSLHFSLGHEFYSKGVFFTGIEYAAVDFPPFARVNTYGNILRIYWGWGF